MQQATAPTAQAILLCSIFMLIGVGFFGLGLQDLLNERGLDSDGKIAQAQTQDFRIYTSRKTGTSYEVQYRFSLPDSSTIYSRADPFPGGRTDLWSTLPKDLWDRSQISHRLDVLYLPRNPWVNRPVHTDSHPVGDSVGGMVIGALIFMIAVANLRPASGPDTSGGASQK